ncbi:MAG: hypothetical protein R3C01_07795 [Planctomycetaceae bacterium]
MRDHIIEDAEREVTIALSRWKNENAFDTVIDQKQTVIMHLSDSILHCLLAFRIDSIERREVTEHEALLPITDFFVATVTLTLTPRPDISGSLSEMRTNAIDTTIVTRLYDVKHFIDRTWLVICHSNQSS